MRVIAESWIEGGGIGEAADRSGRGLRGAAWLAWEDVRASWVSFPVAAVVALVPGFYAALLLGEAFGGSSAGFVTFLLDLWFLLMVAALNVNFLFNRDYYYRFSGDNYTKRLSFLRGLPIGPRTIVAGRAMFMAVALACNLPVFFLVPYLMEAETRTALGPSGYVWFAGIWLGYALFMMGFLLFMWNGLSWRAERLLLPFLFPGWCLLISAVSALVFDHGLVLTLMRAAESSGPPVAGASVALGSVALVLWAVAAERGLQRRELGR